MDSESLKKEAEEKAKKRVKGFKCQDNCEKSYVMGALDFAEPREKRIAELEAEVIRLRNENLDIINKYTRFAETDRRTIAELEAQIEKMKCCGNCENGELSAHEEPCRHCQRCFASADVTDQENVKYNWEAIKEIKEK